MVSLEFFPLIHHAVRQNMKPIPAAYPANPGTELETDIISYDPSLQPTINVYNYISPA
jgi:hypothetical protein